MKIRNLTTSMFLDVKVKNKKQLEKANEKISRTKVMNTHVSIRQNHQL